MDTLHHANEYLKNGWSVIPLLPKTKDTPAISWKEFQERYATQAEVDGWFKGTSNNVGIVTGKISDLTVLDCDGATGVQDAVRLGIVSPITSITGSGGKHLFFKHSGETNKRTSKDHEGLDSRGEGGFVAAAPSIHPSGNAYRWAHGMPRKSALPDWPKGLLQTSPAPSSQNSTVTTLHPSEPWIVNALRGVGSGARHSTLVRLACYLIPRHHYDIVKQNLLDWNQKNTPPMADEEIEKQLNDLVGRFKKGQYKTSYAPQHELHNNQLPNPQAMDVTQAKETEAYFTGQMSATPQVIPDLPTGYPSIDKTTYGLKRGNLFTIGARPGTGKTSFACNVAANLCKTGKRVLYFSTEMSRDELLNKFAAAEGDIPASCFENHNFSQQDRDRLVLFIERFKSYHLHIVRLFAPDRKSVEQSVRDIKPDVVIFDHIQHIATGEHEYGELSRFTRFLKELAMQTNCAIVVASQLSRSAVFNDVIPEMHHLKGCGTIEEESSVVILLHDDQSKDDRPVLFKIAKNRYGKCGSTTIMFKADVTRFEDMGVNIS